MNIKHAASIILVTILSGCGGGGGNADSNQVSVITVSLSTSSTEVSVGSSVTLSWSSTNAQSCSASGDWSGNKSVSGNEEASINNEGNNTFNLSCSGNNATSGSASVQLVSLVNRINITNDIFSNRSSDCLNYVENYDSNARDLTRVIDFEGYVDVEAFETYCNLSSDNIPNHDFNDSTARFANNAIEIERVFRVKRFPELASQNTDFLRSFWDAVLLNGVVVDLQSGGCYSPLSTNANSDGNIPAGCSRSAQWHLVPLEYTSLYGVDIHNAHVQGDGTYHYHGNPNAMFDDSPSGDGSPVIGFAADGFLIYGSYILDEQTGNYRKALSGFTLKQGSRGERTDTNPGGEYTGVYEDDWEWTDAGDLDECNGMVYKGEYGYYITDSFPYIINCFKGEPDSSFEK